MTGTLRESNIHPGRWDAHKCAYSSAVHWTPQEIRRRRNAKGWSQSEAAAAVGVSRRAITNWETGVARPSGSNVEALDRALGDAPVAEPTLRGATDLEFAAEVMRRLGLRSTPGTDGADGAPVELPAEDLAWPRRTRKTRKDLPRKA
jgi:transcriptional regulator with XRE-family HTH domain